MLEPEVFGRFNFTTHDGENYKVVYMPEHAVIVPVIATDLDHEAAKHLMSRLNDILWDFSRTHMKRLEGKKNEDSSG